MADLGCRVEETAVLNRPSRMVLGEVTQEEASKDRETQRQKAQRCGESATTMPCCFLQNPACDSEMGLSHPVVPTWLTM